MFGLLFEWPLKTGFTVLYISLVHCVPSIYNILFSPLENSFDPDHEEVSWSGSTQFFIHMIKPINEISPV